MEDVYNLVGIAQAEMLKESRNKHFFTQDEFMERYAVYCEINRAVRNLQTRFS